MNFTYILIVVGVLGIMAWGYYSSKKEKRQ